MGIEIIGKLTQKNNGDFKLVDLENVDYDGTGKSAKQELEKKIEDAKNSSTPYDDTAIKADIQTLKDNEVTLVKDETSMEGIKDNEYPTLTTQDKTLIGSINEVNSQCKDIVYLIDNPNFELISEGEYKLINDLILTSTLNIPSNTRIRGFGKTITSNFDGVVVNAQGKNITIDGLKINCNQHACTGILINTNSEKVNIVNNEIYNSFGGTTKAVYGIFTSAIGCSDINIQNNTVHDINSNDDKTIGARDGGWAKGIIVDLYDVIEERPNEDSIISTNITIENNTIENIQDSSDADGIYIEGYKCSKKNHVKVINNYFKNCGKRFIKVLNVGDINITGNYGINTKVVDMHSFISLYTGNSTVKGNVMLVQDPSSVRYGVEIGYQAKYEDIYVDNIIIADNFFNIGTIKDYGNVIARPDFDGKINNIEIKNNHLEGGSENIRCVKGANINTVKIINNILQNNVKNRSAISVEAVSINEILIEGNALESNTYSNAISIRNTTKGDLIVKNNKIGKTANASIYVSNAKTCLLENNILNTTNIPYTILECDTKRMFNNFDTRLKGIVEQTPSFIYKTVQENVFDLSVSNNAQISVVKVALSQKTTLSSLTGNQGQIVTIITSGGEGLVIQHTSNVHLKNAVNATLNSMEQSITLVKLDNRWLEISRNF